MGFTVSPYNLYVEVPQSGTVCGDRVFKEVIPLKKGPENGP